MSELGDRPGKVGRSLAAMAALALFFVATRWLREQLGLEMTSESIHDAVSRLGWWAPLGFLALVSVRQAFMLPSVLVLGSAGLLFGAVEGTFIGGLAITSNALIVFAIARNMGADRVRARLHERFPNFEDRARRAGPLFIGLATGHPMGPQTAFHFGAGVTSISVPMFVAVVLPAALFRAGCYAYLGANILEPSSLGFWLASGALILISIAPLGHPRLRAQLFGTLRRPSVVPVAVPAPVDTPPAVVADPVEAASPVDPVAEARD